MVELPRARARREEWTHPEFAAIARVLHETVGLVFPPNRREPAEFGMRRVMTATGISDPGEFRRAIAGVGEAREALITELTIGETFFFREQGQFDFLRDTVLPELRTSIGSGRRLRLWSAGCATGEEPYSLAMLLQDVGWRGAASILGTDLAAARLAAARRARYTAWSMRGVSDAVIDRHFERRGKQFILHSAIRAAVDFQVLNLASPDYPSAASGTDQRDVILCRNVLIYFDLATVTAIATRLLASLAPGGWLFLGASDPAIAELVPCEVELTGSGLAYRPPGTTSGVHSRWSTPPVWGSNDSDLETVAPVDAFQTPASRLSWQELAPPVADDESFATPDDRTGPRDSYESAYDQGDYDAAADLARAAIERGDDDESTWILLVRSLANRGLLDAAEVACADALGRHRLSAELTHLRGMLLAEGGRHTEASMAARRALYLDPQYTVAHLALGDALSRIGDTAGARRAFTNAEALLTGLAPDTPIPGADGAEAAQLLRIARFRIETLGSAPRATHR